MNKLVGIGALALFLAYGGARAGAQEDDLISLVRSGVEEEVLISYIDAAKGPYHLATDQIIQLRNLGASSKVISEALKHDVQKNAEAAQESTQVSPSAIDTTVPPKEADVTSLTQQTVTPPESTSAAPGAPAAPPPEVVAPAPADQNISFFYQALYPYGTWICVDGQWCWRPNAAALDLNWTPYCNNGYWAYTDWGWFWVSNYSWGWAPFHYGRWYRHPGYGWIWMPGIEWGPAWVSFRSCDGYFGWAPLPPAAVFVEHRGFFFNGRLAVGGIEFGLTVGDYRFVPAGYFADRNLWLHTVPASQVRGFFGRTVVLGDNYRFGPDRIINRGPSVQLVSHYTGRGIIRLTIMPDQLRQGDPIRGVIRSNQALIVYKPMIARETPESPSAIGKRYEQGRSGKCGAGTRMDDQGGGLLGRDNGQSNGMYQDGRGHRARQDEGDRERDRR